MKIEHNNTGRGTVAGLVALAAAVVVLFILIYAGLNIAGWLCPVDACPRHTHVIWQPSGQAVEPGPVRSEEVECYGTQFIDGRAFLLCYHRGLNVWRLVPPTDVRAVPSGR